ncbi:hypothetical protein RMATCC62417_12770 [Rhizopus microsporus]|nr:hypothetical protein RMATCC62417_12770 [Rhizopus microsporus]
MSVTTILYPNESLFIERALNPFLNVIFPAGGSMTRDGARIGSKKFDFLAFEIKCLKSTADDDLFKMSLELQFILNRLISCNVNQPVVYGVVGYGMAISGISLKRKRLTNDSEE